MRNHADEIAAFQAGPLSWAIYQATKNIIVFRSDCKGAGAGAVDHAATAAARAEIAEKVTAEFAAKEQKDGPS